MAAPKNLSQNYLIPSDQNFSIPLLPAQLTSFIGRESEIAKVLELLARDDLRLLTMTGTGGTGKTRLALELASFLQENFKDGIVLIELAAINNRSFILQLIARSIGLSEQTGQSLLTTLVRAFGNRQVLLVLDNCEHMVAECGQIAETLLKACPRLKILATSRELLGITGETAFRLPSLTLPSSGDSVEFEALSHFEGIRLFLERAQAADQNFTLSPQNAGVVIELCQRLDGIPLAIELAAGRLGILTVEQLNSRLAGTLGARFRLLTGGSRTALPRQQTLQTLIEWSFDLLTQREQVAFQRMAVFQDGWSLEAAEAVCTGEFNFVGGWGRLEAEEILDLLFQLVNKSLVQVEVIIPGPGAGPEKRYRMLETIRQFAYEKLSGTSEFVRLKIRHCDWAIAQAEQAEIGLNGPEQVKWLDWIEREYQNLQAALSWTIGYGQEYSDVSFTHVTGYEISSDYDINPNRQPDMERSYRLAGALWRFWLSRSYFQEGYRWLQVLPPAPDLPPALKDKVNSGLAVLKGYALYDFEQGRLLYQEKLQSCRNLNDRPGVFAALLELGWSYIQESRFEEADYYARQSLEIARELGDDRAVASALSLLSNYLLCIIGSTTVSKVATLDRAGSNYAEVQASCKNSPFFEVAVAYSRESLELWQRLGDKSSLGSILHIKGYFSVFGSDYLLAKEYYTASYENDYAVGNKQAQLMKSWSLAYLTLFAAPHELNKAVELIGAAKSLMVKFNLVHFPRYFFWVDYTEAIIKDRLSEQEFLASQARGARLNYEQFQSLVAYLLKPDLALASFEVKTAPKTEESNPSEVPSVYPAGLTGREVEVLKLVAEGNTDAEVALKLTLSPRTINAHLRSIYAKLEVTSRRAATQFARQHDLLK